MKKIKVDVLIIIEHKVRELESACLLKYEFEKRSYSVIIDSIYPNKELLPLKYKAKIVLIPWAYDNRDMNYISCFLMHSPDAVIINLHQEQYSGQDDENICLPVGRSTEVYHVSWGNKFSEGLLKMGCKKDTIFTTGNIRLDVYKNKLKGLFTNKVTLSEKYRIDKEKKWVLFIADGFHLMSKQKIDSIAENDPYIYEKVQIANQCRKEFLKYVDRFLSEYDNTIFIYRPHPSYADLDQNTQEVITLCKKYNERFFVIANLSIGNWIVNVNCCISFHSTAAVDCCFANVPYYLFRPSKLDEELDYEFFRGYEFVITDFEEFENALLNQKYDNNVLANKLDGYYLFGNEYSFLTIVDKAIEAKKRDITKPSMKAIINNNIRAYVKEAIQCLGRNHFTRRILLKAKDNRILRIIGRHADTFSKSEIDQIMAKINNCLSQ